MLAPYTYSEQKSKMRAKMLVAYTCGGQMSSGTTYYIAQKAFSHMWVRGAYGTLITLTFSVQLRNEVTKVTVWRTGVN